MRKLVRLQHSATRLRPRGSSSSGSSGELLSIDYSTGGGLVPSP